MLTAKKNKTSQTQKEAFNKDFIAIKHRKTTNKHVQFLRNSLIVKEEKAFCCFDVFRSIKITFHWSLVSISVNPKTLTVAFLTHFAK